MTWKWKAGYRTTHMKGVCIANAKGYALSMSKSKKSESEFTVPLSAMFCEDGGYDLLIDPKYGPDVKWAFNPIIKIDDQIGFLEHGIEFEHEVAEDIVYWIDNALECIEAKGVNYRWSLFKDFNGRFTSRPDTPIGVILREMQSVHEFMNWKPYLERIRSIAAIIVKTDIPDLDQV